MFPEILESGSYGPHHTFHHHNGYSSGWDDAQSLEGGLTLTTD